MARTGRMDEESTQKSTNTSAVEEDASTGRDIAAGLAVAGAAVAAAGLVWKLFSSSSKEEETMKAPGRDERNKRRDKYVTLSVTLGGTWPRRT